MYCDAFKACIHSHVSIKSGILSSPLSSRSRCVHGALEGEVDEQDACHLTSFRAAADTVLDEFSHSKAFRVSIYTRALCNLLIVCLHRVVCYSKLGAMSTPKMLTAEQVQSHLSNLADTSNFIIFPVMVETGLFGEYTFAIL